MASLKTIKTNYDLLTMSERFGLYQKASLRRDESELAAIYAATPMKTFNVIDFYFLREEIYRIDTVNLLQRLGHSSMCNLFLRLSSDEEKEKEGEQLFQSACLSAYLYVIETDAWQIVCDELGFEVNWFRKLAGALSFAVEMMDKHDDLLRQFAFDEDKARKFLKQNARKFKYNTDFEIKTLGEQVRFYRDFIESL